LKYGVGSMVSYSKVEDIMNDYNKIENHYIEFEIYTKTINGRDVKFIKITETDENGKKKEIITRVDTLKRVCEALPF